MSAVTTSSSLGLRLRPACLAAGIAVGGALAMTVILGATAMLASAVRGLPASEAPLLLTDDAVFPLFCAAAGVFTALAAGYITTRANARRSWQHAVASGVLTVAVHSVVVAVLGSPLPPAATAVYVGLTLPAVCVGCYLGAPVASCD